MSYIFAGLSEKTVQMRLARILAELVKRPFHPGVIYTFGTWYRGFKTPQEREVIQRCTSVMLIDAERRLKLLKEALQVEVFRKGG